MNFFKDYERCSNDREFRKEIKQNILKNSKQGFYLQAITKNQWKFLMKREIILMTLKVFQLHIVNFHVFEFDNFHVFVFDNREVFESFHVFVNFHVIVHFIVFVNFHMFVLLNFVVALFF